MRVKPKELKGVKGALPLRCLPLWGREGVTLVIDDEYNQITGDTEFFGDRDHKKF